MKFAKLFDLEDGNQVLITKECNEENDQWQILQRTEVNEVEAVVRLGWFDESKVNVLFDEYDISNAVGFRALVVDFFKSLAEVQP
jgi:hypothetical protein